MKPIRPEVQKMMGKYHVTAAVATAIWEDGFKHGSGQVEMTMKRPEPPQPAPEPETEPEPEDDEE